MYVELRPCGEVLTINLSNRETDLLCSLLELVSRDSFENEELTLDEVELAYKLAKELDYYSSWDMKK